MRIFFYALLFFFFLTQSTTFTNKFVVVRAEEAITMKDSAEVLRMLVIDSFDSTSRHIRMGLNTAMIVTTAFPSTWDFFC